MSEREGEDRGHAVEHGKTSHHHRGYDHDDADRQIDACGEDHQGLADPENACDHHLGQNGRDVAGGGEARRIDRHSEQQAKHQHDEGNGGRVGMEEALETLEKRELLLVEGGDRSRRSRQHFLEFLLRRAAGWRCFAHGFLARFPIFLGVFGKPALREFRLGSAGRQLFSRLSSESQAKSTPAELRALFDADRGDARAPDDR